MAGKLLVNLFAAAPMFRVRLRVHINNFIKSYYNVMLIISIHCLFVLLEFISNNSRYYLRI